MTYAILTLAVLILFTYRQQLRGNRSGEEFRKNYTKVAALLCMTIVPVVLMNSWYPWRKTGSPEEELRFGKKYQRSDIVLQALSDLRQKHPDNIPLQLEYADEILKLKANAANLNDFDFHFQKTWLVMQTYVKLCTDGTDAEVESFLARLTENEPYTAYLKALYALKRKRDYSMKTQRLLWQELRVNPDAHRPANLLWEIYLETDNEQAMRQFMLNDRLASCVDGNFRNDYYFVHGDVGLYFREIFRSRLGQTDWLTFLASLLVSFVWVIFLRSMDVFNREKWGPILLVFLGGALFTFLCLPIYDFSHIYLRFGINGEATNDFWYCVTVIGGGEELVKWIPWMLFATFSRRMREPYDYLLYASVAALGFAFTENLMYLAEPGNIVARTIMSSVGHMFFASVIAYAVILAKYRYTHPLLKVILPLLGYVLAATAHGFYDFWLVSDAVEGYYFLTMIFFLGSLHVWFFFKNNALNNSMYFTGSRAYNAVFQQDLLTFSLLGVLIAEFLFVSVEFGAANGNRIIYTRSVHVFFFLVYLSFILQRFSLEKGVWRKWKFQLPPFIRNLISIPFLSGTEKEDATYQRDFVGLQLRLFAPKSNPYIGDKLPKSGECVRRITVNGNPNWYVFRLNTPLHYGNMVPTHIILKNKLPEQPLNQPKIEIYFMFIPDIFLLESPNLDITQLRYAGRAYSMPL